MAFLLITKRKGGLFGVGNSTGSCEFIRFLTRFCNSVLRLKLLTVKIKRQAFSWAYSTRNFKVIYS